MFRLCYLAVFRQLTPKVYKTQSNKTGHNKDTYAVVPKVQNFTGFGYNYVHKYSYNIMLVKR